MTLPSGLRPLRALTAVGLVLLAAGAVGSGPALVVTGASLPGSSPLRARSDQSTESSRLALARPGVREPVVRVLLQQAAALEPRAVAGALLLRDGQGRTLAVLPPGERLRIQRLGSTLRLERPDADPSQAPPQRISLQELWLEPASGLEAREVAPLLPWVASAPQMAALPSSLIGLGRQRYRGLLRLRPATDGLQAINHIPLEHYLPSVVGSEMPARWPAAALRAQAVAARTYALAQLKPSAPFDVRATVASQAYLGVEAETESTRAAVAATRLLVLRHGDVLIDAVFHSSSGGSTENSGELWGRQLPYLVSVPDQDDLSPWREWSLRFSSDQLRALFRETGGVSRIDVIDTSSTGRVQRARVSGPSGSLDLSGTELRRRLGLRSTLVRFQLEPSTPPGRLGPIAAAIQAATASLAAGSGPIRPTAAPLPPPPAPVTVSSLPELQAARPDQEGPGEAQASFRLPSLSVVGRGFGHGVGMSQWGAYGLALRGRSHEEILRHYYRGARLVPFSQP